MESVKIKKEEPGKSNDNSQEERSYSKEHIENMAMSFHQRILNTIPDVNVKFAAHKATEYAMLHKSASQLEEYLIEAIRDPNLPRVGTVWDQQDATDPEHQRLCLYVYNQFLSEQVDFLALTIPDADPEFLDEKVKIFQGNVNHAWQMH